MSDEADARFEHWSKRAVELAIEKAQVEARALAAKEGVIAWLRSDEAEAVRVKAMEDGIPPEDALAHALEARRSSTVNEKGAA